MDLEALNDDICPECRVPGYITTAHRWTNSGTIVQTGNRESRPYFIESENLDPLFHGICQIVGAPIEPVVITAKRRNVRTYIEGVIPAETKELLARRGVDWRPVNDYLRMTAG